MKPGKFDAALAFIGGTSRVLYFKAAENVAYVREWFRGSASFWIRVEPAAIQPHYAEPLPITDKDYNNGCVWVDFTKNDTPPDFRWGVFGDQPIWEPRNQHNLAEAFFWRLAKVAEPPFAAGIWTHVVPAWRRVWRLRRARLLAATDVADEIGDRHRELFRNLGELGGHIVDVDRCARGLADRAGNAADALRGE